MYADEELLLQTSNNWKDSPAGQMVRRYEREVWSSSESNSITKLILEQAGLP